MQSDEEHDQAWREAFSGLLERTDMRGVQYRSEIDRGDALKRSVDVAKRECRSAGDGAFGTQRSLQIHAGRTTRRVLRNLPCSILAVGAQSS